MNCIDYLIQKELNYEPPYVEIVHPPKMTILPTGELVIGEFRKEFITY